MPQLILEYSNNVIEKNEIKTLLRNINYYLADHLPTQLDQCKSRALARDCYCIGNNEAEHAFVHLTLSILPGRALEKREAVGRALKEMLANYFHDSLQQLALQITIEIRELESYFK